MKFLSASCAFCFACLPILLTPGVGAAVAPTARFDVAAESGLFPSRSGQQLLGVRNLGAEDVGVVANCTIAGVVFRSAQPGGILLKRGQAASLGLLPENPQQAAALRPGTYQGNCLVNLVGPKGARDENPRNDRVAVSLQVVVATTPRVAEEPSLNLPASVATQPQPVQESILASFAQNPMPGSATLNVLFDEFALAHLAAVGAVPIESIQNLIAATNSLYLTHLGGGPGVSLQITSIRVQPSQSLGIHQGDNLATIINQLVLLREIRVDLQNTDLTLLLTGASAGSLAVSYQDSLCGQQVQYPVIAMRVEGMFVNQAPALLAHHTGHAIGFSHVNEHGVMENPGWRPPQLNPPSTHWLMGWLPVPDANGLFQWSPGAAQRFLELAGSLTCLGN